MSFYWIQASCRSTGRVLYCIYVIEYDQKHATSISIAPYNTSSFEWYLFVHINYKTEFQFEWQLELSAIDLLRFATPIPQKWQLWIKLGSNNARVSTRLHRCDDFKLNNELSSRLGYYSADQLSLWLTDRGPPLQPYCPFLVQNTGNHHLFITITATCNQRRIKYLTTGVAIVWIEL